MNDGRRRVAKSLATLLGVGVTFGAGVAFYALHIAPLRPRLRQLTVDVPAGAEHLHGFRIAFVTDTHVGPSFRAEDLAPTERLVRESRPHLVLLGGDYVSESPRFAARAAERLGAMAAVAPYGAYAVLGNHDLSCGATRVKQALADVGIPVLRNRAVHLVVHGGPLWIAGIDEALLSRPDPRATFEQIPAGSPAIALWHESDFAERVAPFDPMIQLSGHSHGGQVRLPLLGPLATPAGGRRYVRGLYDVAGMPLYVSSGTGVYRPPARLFCPPEVTLLTLRARAEGRELARRSALGSAFTLPTRR